MNRAVPKAGRLGSMMMVIVSDAAVVVVYGGSLGLLLSVGTLMALVSAALECLMLCTTFVLCTEARRSRNRRSRRLLTFKLFLGFPDSDKIASLRHISYNVDGVLICNSVCCADEME